MELLSPVPPYMLARSYMRRADGNGTSASSVVGASGERDERGRNRHMQVDD